MSSQRVSVEITPYLMSFEKSRKDVSLMISFEESRPYLTVNIHHGSIPNSSTPVLHFGDVVTAEPSGERRIVRGVVLQIYGMEVGRIGSREDKVDHRLWLDRKKNY